MNLTIGISLMFIYVFMLKIVEVLGASPDSSPLLLVCLPNIVFGGIGNLPLFKCKKVNLKTTCTSILLFLFGDLQLF